jgi:UDP-perosamine 4-acetyltransferase
MSISVIILGAGGHAKVLITALMASSVVIAGIVDSDTALIGTKIFGIPVLGGDGLVVNEFSSSETMLVNGLGSVSLPVKRKQLFENFKSLGYGFVTVIHPSAVIALDVVIDEGAQVMAGAVIQTGTRIGSNCIINTRASVDHDCSIGDHSHIAPGVTLSGGVTVGACSHIGTGATVVQGVSIGAESIIGAGSVVLKDVAPRITVVGVPAKMVKR